MPSFAVSDELNYIYDEAGRLIKVVGFVYQYDEVGNLLSITSSSISATPPVIQNINPDMLFTGSTTSVAIQGQNIFSTKEVIFDNPCFCILKTLHVTDTQINTEMTVSTDASPMTTNQNIKRENKYKSISNRVVT